MKKIVLVMSGFIFMIMAIPMALAAVYSGDGSRSADDEKLVTVFREGTGEHEVLELEYYLIGVVAAEMPALFDMEALKAQAIAARTYALKILENNDYLLDTVMHQVFLDEEQLRERWGDDFYTHHAVIKEAVMATRGMVLVYDDELITPMFFALSSGETENSEDVFVEARPYLRSVDSSWDREHPRFEYSVEFSWDELRERFDDPGISRGTFMILDENPSGSIEQTLVGVEMHTGREVREILGLRSAAFSIERNGTEGVIITTYGHGHGVGMSQNGANFMALDGYNHVEILEHYYQFAQVVEKNSISFE